MRSNSANKRYLNNYLEKDLATAPADRQWSHCIVIPVYQESKRVLQYWIERRFASINLLVIFVINRPDGSDPHGNEEFRKATQSCDRIRCAEHTYLLPSEQHNDILSIDLDMQRGALPRSEGVGLARKTGCDLALLWHAFGNIESPILYSTDADAHLPDDYFERIKPNSDQAAIFTFPFSHVSASEPDIYEATLWYELWLHHYVLGLEFAGSPYAYHSLGSSLAISSKCYAQVGGFPKRAGGEDFYLLNKANKTSNVVRLKGRPIELQARLSTRVPFGTGPGVEKILQSKAGNEALAFYHPEIFFALRGCLQIIPKLRSRHDVINIETLLESEGLSNALATASNQALKALGFVEAIEHCRKHGKTQEQFIKQFNQWFDGFKTLKFIHAIKASEWPDLSFKDLKSVSPSLWPNDSAQADDVLALQKIIQDYWGWQ